jgi:hypothetical protein
MTQIASKEETDMSYSISALLKLNLRDIFGEGEAFLFRRDSTARSRAHQRNCPKPCRAISSSESSRTQALNCISKPRLSHWQVIRT